MIPGTIITALWWFPFSKERISALPNGPQKCLRSGRPHPARSTRRDCFARLESAVSRRRLGNGYTCRQPCSSFLSFPQDKAGNVDDTKAASAIQVPEARAALPHDLYEEIARQTRRAMDFLKQHLQLTFGIRESAMHDKSSFRTRLRLRMRKDAYRIERGSISQK